MVAEKGKSTEYPEPLLHARGLGSRFEWEIVLSRATTSDPHLKGERAERCKARAHGGCRRPRRARGRAGVCRTTAQNAIRAAKRLVDLPDMIYLSGSAPH